MAQIQEIAQDPVNVGIGNIESTGSYGAKNPNSSARGKYQFIESTFNGVQRNNPDLPKVSFQEFQQNPDIQEKYQAALRQENQKVLNKNGLEVTPSNEYIVHFAGAPRGTALLKAPDEMPLKQFFPEKVLQSNRLSGDMSVGDFKSTISQKMMNAMGKYPNAGQGQGGAMNNRVAPGTPIITNGVDPANASAPVNPTAPALGFKLTSDVIDPKVVPQLEAFDAISKKINSAPVGTPEGNLAIADAIQHGNKKEFGPNWTNAILAAAFGNKDQALTWITGGKQHAPVIGDAIINGAARQVLINKNDRGDMWYTDPSTGERLADGTQIVSLSPDNSISGSIARRNISSGLAPNGQLLSDKERALHEVEQQNTTEHANMLKGDQTLIQGVAQGTKQFSKVLNNVTAGPTSNAVMQALNSFNGVKIDEEKARNAARLLNLEDKDVGPFYTYLNSVAQLNSSDKNKTFGSNAPGAATHGPLELVGGTPRINSWLIERNTSYAIQQAYNNYYDQERQNTGKSVKQIKQDFTKTDTFKAIENYKRASIDRKEGRPISLKDGDPIARFEDGILKVGKWDSQTGKVK
jgi:hypothetical protein